MSDSPLPPTEETTVMPLRWPPPGLGRIQGDLWLLARKMGAVAAVLVMPLLIVLTLPQSPYGLGPLGEAWWIILLTTILGVAIFADAAVSLVRFLGRVRRAFREGYSTHIVALVVADRDRDNGFLLQGIHTFTPLKAPERRTLGRLRFLIPFCYLVAATWLVVGFGILLLVAARGGLSLSGVGFGTLAPAAVVGFAGLVLRGTEGTIAYRSREAWHRNEWAQDLVRQEIAAWRTAGEERDILQAEHPKRGARAWPTAAVVGVVVGGLIAVVPAMTLVPASSLGAVFTSVGSLPFQRTLQRSAEVEAYRDLRLDPDPSVTAAEAGEILHVVNRVGAGAHPAEELRAPARTYDEPWVPESGPEGFRPAAAPYWTDTIWSWVERGLAPEEAAYLREVADHPARAELSRLATAGSLDLIDAVYERPFGDRMTFFSLPIPRMAGMRAAASSHLAAAALHAAEGRHDEAEQTTREVISVGFLLADEAPLIIANLIGSVLIKNGGRALEHAVEIRGDAERAATLRARIDVAEAAAERMAAAGEPRPGSDEYLHRLPALAEDERVQPGLRWESAHLVTILSPCANLRRVAFGPDEDYFRWMERVRTSLVRHESEEAYFEVAMRGLAPIAEPSLLSRVVAVAMGGIATQGSCAQVLAVLPDIQ